MRFLCFLMSSCGRAVSTEMSGRTHQTQVLRKQMENIVYPFALTRKFNHESPAMEANHYKSEMNSSP